ncbi:hypothetical protein DFJ74DRAFT_707303 [Hyaloraphidium curvatum]|nr:hypothetical protein DFJ74DRAFT_714713 [Hyaloraphidium curvatum]KAI9021351.1 hypothetical protein DFJ74DRAFT_707303 [Hyaloraphidium curvatum]
MGVPALQDPTSAASHGDPSAPHGDPSAPDADFSPEEWVCLFPAATPPFRPLLQDEEAGEAGGDPAAEFRGAHPVTFETMLADFDDPVLRMFAFLSASPTASFLGWRTTGLTGLSECFMLAFQGLAWAWNDGRFGTKQMAVGMASLAIIASIGFGTFVLYALAVPRVPKRNNLISVVASAYHDARRDLRTACLKLGPTPLAAALEQHDRVIGSFLEVSRYSAKILGFTVTYGGVRTMVVTMVTLSVALWSVFRSLGVFFTMESFCPLVD